MKRLFLALAMIVGISAVGVCQNVNVNVNGSNYGDGYKYINGICSCEDIGGVEVQRYRDSISENGTVFYYEYAQFQNYNDFRVTVAYELELNMENGFVPKIGNVVLEPNGSKREWVEYYVNGLKNFRLTGLIVRKMAQ